MVRSSKALRAKLCDTLGVRLFQAIRSISPRLSDLARQGLDDLKVLAAEPSVTRIRQAGAIDALREVELRVFSQFGDDGIIQYLIHHLKLVNDTFVEFGVSDYRESNTRFLLVHDNWQGFVIDGSPDNVAEITRDIISWRHDLVARAAFVTRENIGSLLTGAGVPRRVGLLHIDLDGNDYWVWEALDSVEGDIVIMEYNAVFGGSHAISIPYDPAFVRRQAHPSCLYWGASVEALRHLGERKGYRFIGCNSAGNNAYFVKRELAGSLPDPGADGFVDSRFRESRGANGELTFLRGDARLQAIRDMEVVDVIANQRIRLGQLSNR